MMGEITVKEHAFNYYIAELEKTSNKLMSDENYESRGPWTSSDKNIWDSSGDSLIFSNTESGTVYFNNEILPDYFELVSPDKILILLNYIKDLENEKI